MAKEISFYCVKGRHKVMVKDAVQVTLRPGRSGVRMKAWKGICPIHGITMYKFIGKLGKDEWMI